MAQLQKVGQSRSPYRMIELELERLMKRTHDHGMPLHATKLLREL